MSWLGVLSHKFEDVGVFTYWLQDDCNSVSPASYCSIVGSEESEGLFFLAREWFLDMNVRWSSGVSTSGLNDRMEMGHVAI